MRGAADATWGALKGAFVGACVAWGWTLLAFALVTAVASGWPRMPRDALAVVALTAPAWIGLIRVMRELDPARLERREKAFLLAFFPALCFATGMSVAFFLRG
jgi:hypothetical protein